MKAARSGRIIPVEGRLTIDRAAELHAVLSEALAESCGVKLDLSAVSTIDVAGMQLLIAAHRKWTSRKQTFTLIDPSAAVLETIEMLGLEGHFTREGASA